MKKIFLFILFIAIAIVGNAQIKKTDSASLKKDVKPAVKTLVSKNVAQQTTQQILVAPLPKTSQTATGQVLTLKERDLALSDFTLLKDVNTGKYTMSCKISNKGTRDINLATIAYSKCVDESYVTEQYGLIVLYKIEPDNCSLSGCGYTGFLYVYKADGTEFNVTNAPVIKPGQSFIAKTMYPQDIYWGKPSPCSSTRIEISLVLDPINRSGDQDLSNNTLKMYYPIQN